MEHVKHMCQAFEQDTWELISLSEGQQRMDISNMGSLNTLVLAGALDCSYPSTCFHVRHMYCSSDHFKVHLTHLTLKISVFFFFLHVSPPLLAGEKNVERFENQRHDDIHSSTSSNDQTNPMSRSLAFSHQSAFGILQAFQRMAMWKPSNDVVLWSWSTGGAILDGKLMDSGLIWFGCVTDICSISPFSIILIHFYSETMSYNVIVHLRLAGKDRLVKAYLDWLFVRLSTIDDPWLYYSNAFSGNVAQDCNAGHHGSLWLHDVVSYHISIIYHVFKAPITYLSFVYSASSWNTEKCLQEARVVCMHHAMHVNMNAYSYS